MRKIAIIGEQCAGKSTIAEIIKQLVSHPTVVKFADPIYRSLEALGQEKGPGWRGFAQESSDVAKKYYGDDVYVRAFEHTVEQIELLGFAQTLICDDVRYPDELDLCRELGFKFIYVSAFEFVRMQRAAEQGLEFKTDHSSERQVKELKAVAGVVINNSGNSLAILRDQLINALYGDLGIERPAA